MTVTIEIEPEEMQVLAAHAQRLGVPVERTAADAMRAELRTVAPRRNPRDSIHDSRSIAERLAALEAFNQAPDNRAAAGLPPVDLSGERGDVYGYTEREDAQR